MFGIPYIVPDMPDAMTNIADRVRGIAVEKRFTHDRIASLLRLSRTSVSARMNGSIPWTGAELLILAAAFRISPARFFPDLAQLHEFSPEDMLAAAG